MSIASKHRKAAPGDRATFAGEAMTVHKIDGDSLTLVDAARTMYVGVSRGHKLLRVEPGTAPHG